MALTSYNRDPVLCRHLVERGAFAGTDFHFFDVGVSGGIDRYWRHFAPNLKVWGFDPLVKEIERLNGLGLVTDTYEAAFVGCHDYRSRHTHAEWWTPEARSTQFFPRTTAQWAQDLLEMNWNRDVDNRGAELQLADRVVELDGYCVEQGIGRVDFIKIDTDGSDYEVLQGARGLLQGGGILGLQVEAQFHGAALPEANLFSNIDLMLRQHGFALFDLDLWHYSRAALPRPFVYDMAAQTTRGQLSWGEALFLRDLGDPLYETKWPDFAITVPVILKSVALFDIYSLQDCAIEVLLKYSGQLTEAGWDIEALADLVVPPVDGRRIGYRDFIALCEDKVRQRRFKDIPG